LPGQLLPQPQRSSPPAAALQVRCSTYVVPLFTVSACTGVAMHHVIVFACCCHRLGMPRPAPAQLPYHHPL
jgi:hypothetical protein